MELHGDDEVESIGRGEMEDTVYAMLWRHRRHGVKGKEKNRSEGVRAVF